MTEFFFKYVHESESPRNDLRPKQVFELAHRAYHETLSLAVETHQMESKLRQLYDALPPQERQARRLAGLKMSFDFSVLTVGASHTILAVVWDDFVMRYPNMSSQSSINLADAMKRMIKYAGKARKLYSTSLGHTAA